MELTMVCEVEDEFVEDKFASRENGLREKWGHNRAVSNSESSLTNIFLNSSYITSQANEVFSLRIGRPEFAQTGCTLTIAA